MNKTFSAHGDIGESTGIQDRRKQSNGDIISGLGGI
jgi:hypothetical protein